jgi:plasmid maintenance system antidote protein VapI
MIHISLTVNKKLKGKIKMLTKEKIREKLQDRNIVKVAELSGVSQSTIHDLIKDRREIGIGSLYKLSKYLEG